jgi:hypothetical protein
MKQLKEIAYCVAPYVVTCAAMYLVGAFLSASWDVAEWERTDRAFCAICAAVFGTMLLIRLDLGKSNETAQHSYLGLDKAPQA